MKKLTAMLCLTFALFLGGAGTSNSADFQKETEDQETDHPKPSLEPSTPSGLKLNQGGPDPALDNRLRRPKGFDDGHME